jgi:hypothetical protein
LPYAYLPLAASGQAAVSWGHTATLAGFVRHVTRAEYGTFQLASTHVGGATTAVDHVLAYARDVGPQTLWLGALLALVGAVAGLVDRRLRGAVAACLVGLFAYLVVFNVLSNLPLTPPLLFEVQARFWQTPNLIVFVLVGLGFAAVVAWLPRGRGAVAAAAAVAIGAVAVQAYVNWSSMDESRMRWIDAYGRSVLAPAPPGALILSRGDLTTNVIHYLRYVEGTRPDVRIIDQEILSLPWGPPRYARLLPDVRFPAAVYDPRQPDGFSMKQLLDANVERVPIMACGGIKEDDRSVSAAAYRLLPRGSCTEVTRAGSPLAVDAWLARNRALLPDAGALARAPVDRRLGGADPRGRLGGVARARVLHHDVRGLRPVTRRTIFAVRDDGGRDHASRPEPARLRAQEPHVRARSAVSTATGCARAVRGGDAGLSAGGAEGRSGHPRDP